jgi:hypothetical protein
MAYEKNDSEILFSKNVKAGKRVYYFDVKRDRRGEMYVSLTESKRLKDVGEDARPVFEKHKIFLYQEDMENFKAAFLEALDYVDGQKDVKEEPASTPLNAILSDLNVDL